MGYFRIFYYIAYIFNTICRLFKRHGKQILWIVCIFGFLIFCMWPSKSHADYSGTDYDYADGYKLAQWTYNRDVLGFLRRYENVTSSSYTALKEEINTNFHNDRYNYFIFRGGTTSESHGEAIANTYNYNNNFYYLVFYHLNPYYWTRESNQYLYYGIDGINMSTTTSTDNETYPFIVYRLNGVGQIYKFSTSEVYNYYFYAPDFALLQGNEYIYEYFYNNKTLEAIELLYEMNSKLDSIEDTMTELPVDNSISSDEFPTDSGVDTTDLDNGLNGLFGQIAEAFTDIPRSKYNITVPVPFTDKSFIIPYNLTSSALSDSNFSWVTSIISAFWYYVVGRYILIDIINKFEHIQSGNIENMENDNIKEDLL